MTWKDSFPKENRYFETSRGILYNAEAIETMSKFPEQIFDAIITDPPYGITACKWDTVISFQDMWKQLKRIRKNRTPIVLFGSEPFSSYLRTSNIKEYKYDWVWNKRAFSNPMLAKYQPLRITENISVFSKEKHNYYPQGLIEVNKETRQGQRMTENFGRGTRRKKYFQKYTNYPRNIVEFSKDRPSLHPTQKPLALMEYLVRTYTKENDLTLDFTCGSGNTLVACEKLNRRWIGIELGSEYCKIAATSIETVEGNSLFN